MYRESADEEVLCLRPEGDSQEETHDDGSQRGHQFLVRYTALYQDEGRRVVPVHGERFE